MSRATLRQPGEWIYPPDWSLSLKVCVLGAFGRLSKTIPDSIP